MAGRRSGRAAAKRAAAALESTPNTWDELEDNDEAMPDADVDDEQQPADEGDEDGDETANVTGDGDAEATEKDESVAEPEPEEPEEAPEKSPSPPPVPMVRRKRLGRPPKIKPPGWDDGIEVPRDETPRRRGRGGWRGRGGRKGAPAPITQQAIEKDGPMYNIIDDELDLPQDPEGETKVDKLGYLQGGREYRCRTFTVKGRGDRLYMLSTEPARCVGFRDSYLFFTKHRRLFKVIVDDEEKRDLIERELIPHSYKGRSIGIVTARSVFREFGALIVVGGRRIIDDYDIGRAREEGFQEGVLADPLDKVEQPYNRNQYVAWFGASQVYHTNQPAAPTQIAEMKKRRVAVNDVNWMLEHAREAANFNAQINAIRRRNNNGVYDVHTNTMQYPTIMQPTAARIQQIPPSATTSSDTASQVFPVLSPSIPRNFMVTDTYYETPPAGISAASYDARAYSAVGGDDFLAPFRGLGAISDDIKDTLPAECRQAFDEALAREKNWHSKWGTEAAAKSRRDPIIDKAIVPYSVVR
ncbi:chromatin structure-remodeling complex subunit RSC7 [Gnomoniopsis smithogilvyi]|uniref:Chromatin structure-remodeling complex subunit RSC7 n=1 Tax=Gnomoniopsis smithogilvyi TaxID=1191159 RepID=A0A9W8YLI0_9PEZI|nr:chromatin structure-remodeling complex subunit RSC7 [Gnomoniopsis smithogilvyi]